jgi:hypothetical protein
MTAGDLDEIIKAALVDIAHGQLVNASAFKGTEQEKHLSDGFDMLIALAETAKKVAARKFIVMKP